MLGSMQEAYGMFSALQKVPMESATHSAPLNHRNAAQHAAWEEFSFLGRCCAALCIPDVVFACACTFIRCTIQKLHQSLLKQGLKALFVFSFLLQPKIACTRSVTVEWNLIRGVARGSVVFCACTDACRVSVLQMANVHHIGLLLV